MSGAITFLACENCGHRWVLGRRACPRCGSGRIARCPASGRGRLYSATIVHRAPDEAFAAIAPYRIALVDLDEGPRLMAHLDGEAAIGTRLRGRAETVAGREIPVFVTDEDAG